MKGISSRPESLNLLSRDQESEIGARFNKTTKDDNKDVKHEKKEDVPVLKYIKTQVKQWYSTLLLSYLGIF